MKVAILAIVIGLAASLIAWAVYAAAKGLYNWTMRECDKPINLPKPELPKIKEEVPEKKEQQQKEENPK